MKTMILPHPNELKYIAETQRLLCSNITRELKDQDENGYCAPILPLFIDTEPEQLHGSVTGCTILAPVITGTKIMLPAKIETAECKDTISGILVIAEIKCPKKNTDFHELSVPLFDLFPLNLPVFRIADVKIENTENSCSWSILSSYWVKTTRK